MKNNTIIGLVAAIALLGIFLIGSSITGFVVMGPGVKTLCSSEYACNEPEVCCPFYGEENAGVCDSQAMCAKILEITKEQKEKRVAFLSLGEDLQKMRFVHSIIGMIISSLAILVIVFYLKNHRFDEEVKAIPRKKKRAVS